MTMSASSNTSMPEGASSNHSSLDPIMAMPVSSSTPSITPALMPGFSKDLPGGPGWASGNSSQPYLEFLTCMTTQQTTEEVAVFDPESATEDNGCEESDEEEGKIFRQKARGMEQSPRMVKTRSITRSLSLSSVVEDLTGKVVFAHKGKTIPCWFPGKVLRKSKKGYDVEFYASLGVETCTLRNVMSYDEYFLKKKENSPLFKIPTKLRQKFEEALKTARKN